MRWQGIAPSVGLILLFVSPIALARDLHVPTDHPTVASGLAAAHRGDRVVLAPGTYHEHDLRLADGVTVVGNPSNPASVVIDAGQQGRVALAEDLVTTVNLAGLTLTGGSATGATSHDASGGALLIVRATVEVRDVHFVGNRATASGGAVRCLDATPLLSRCVFRDNEASAGGGAVDGSCDASPRLDSCTFEHNRAAWGGGVSLRTTSAATFNACTFRDNSATTAPGLGGAVACDLGAAPLFYSCLIVANAAIYGGALYSASAAGPTLVRCTIADNSAQQSCGGLYCKGASPHLDHALVCFNEREAFRCSGEARPVLVASDVYGHAGGDWTSLPLSEQEEAGNICADPLFCESGSYTVAADSPCVAAAGDDVIIGARPVACETALPRTMPEPPTELSLRAFPNPFNPRVTLAFTLVHASRVRVRVCDLRGRTVADLVDEALPSGAHMCQWNGCDDAGRAQASGTYVAIVEADGARTTSKLQLIR